MRLKTLQYTQEQVRDIAGVSPGDVRQWRKSVQYLAAKPGKMARFAFSDVVGLALTREFTSTLGIRISEISAGVDALFRALSEVKPARLEDLIAVVGRKTARLIPVNDFTSRKILAPQVVVPCGPILTAISARMMPIAPHSTQTTLPFPPHSVRVRG